MWLSRPVNLAHRFAVKYLISGPNLVPGFANIVSRGYFVIAEYVGERCIPCALLCHGSDSSR